MHKPYGIEILPQIETPRSHETECRVPADCDRVAPGGAMQAALRVPVGLGAIGGREGAGDLPERARRPRQVPDAA